MLSVLNQLNWKTCLKTELKGNYMAIQKAFGLWTRGGQARKTEETTERGPFVRNPGRGIITTRNPHDITERRTYLT